MNRDRGEGQDGRRLRWPGTGEVRQPTADRLHSTCLSPTPYPAEQTQPSPAEMVTPHLSGWGPLKALDPAAEMDRDSSRNTPFRPIQNPTAGTTTQASKAEAPKPKWENKKNVRFQEVRGPKARGVAVGRQTLLFLSRFLQHVWDG